jgi:hypothetical protein
VQVSYQSTPHAAVGDMPCECRQFQRARCVTAEAKRSSITLADGCRPARGVRSQQGKQWAATAEERTGHGCGLLQRQPVVACARALLPDGPLGRRITGRGRVSRASHGADSGDVMPVAAAHPAQPWNPALSTASPPAPPHLSYHHHPALALRRRRVVVSIYKSARFWDAHRLCCPSSAPSVAR